MPDPGDIEGKIAYIMELTGAPPDIRAHARLNYLRLYAFQGEAELDKKIATFEEMERRIVKWRNERPVPGAKPATT